MDKYIIPDKSWGEPYPAEPDPIDHCCGKTSTGYVLSDGKDVMKYE